jgi:DNA-binding beta-propeller fold protein YncE
VSGPGERWWIVAAAAAAVVLAVTVLAIAGVFSGDDGDPGDNAEDGFGAVTTTDAAPPAPQPSVRRYEVGGRPDTIGAGGGYVWVSDSFAGTLSRINPASKRPIPVEPAGFPTDVSAAEGGSAWLALADRGAVQRVSATEGPAEPVEVGGFPFQVAAGEGAVWAMSQDTVERIDPQAGAVQGSAIPLEGDGSSIAAGEGGVWVTRSNRDLVRIDSGNGSIAAAAEVPGAFNVAVGESAVWALGASKGSAAGTLTRLDPASGEVAGAAIPVSQALDVAAGLGFVWVVGANGTVSRFDPATGSPIGRQILVGRQPQSISVGEGSAWVACAGAGAVFRITP